ncbi:MULTISPECIES: glycerol-3-phosphate dehydrogenase [unclassified Legionella]|uniref:glycerol-3-phosphate dehydrogenase n=1 Tax=unclassified Legionella TaxID=2622702 RepID=UPI00105415A1|nr:MULTISPECIES: glycerol-3-phosphate dehydrogenase [unclassified Legionella]MDI9819722.1 glycerol-3-phosphate dehydrogenase [Legionella sp. PL877]
MEEVFDVAIIGGGINGCGIAADAALRGLSVILFEKGDIASQTSSSSSKLIHGGLRYLEYYDFRLVKKALDERQRLLKIAPHLIHAIPFVLPYQQGMRPAWLLRTGLFLYDNLSRKNKLPRSKFIRRIKHSTYFAPLKEEFNKGFVFYDCTTDDSRLTITNALQAKKHGALIQNYTQLTQANVKDKIWYLTVKSKLGEKTAKAKTIINAAGPWVESVNNLLDIPNKFKMSLVKGSHMVVHKLYEGNHAYLLQHKDKRIVFVVPYHHHTMIGTTDIAFNDSLDEINISSEEINYLSDLINNYLRHPIQKEDIIHTWSGVRPLLAATGEELRTLSRDYSYHYTGLPAPAITIYGGKITTYRQLAQEVVDELRHVFPYLKKSQTREQTLPGSQLREISHKDYLSYVQDKYFWLPDELRQHYLNNYGTRAESLLANCTKMPDLGYDFGHGLYQVEVDYLHREEWAQSCDDILWRRTKLGLNFTPEDKQILTEYLSNINGYN